MKLPQSLAEINEWVLVGPMGPELGHALAGLPVLAVDGGARFVRRPDVWVGDSDSYEDAPECEHVFRFPPAKDVSDLALALSIYEGKKLLHLWGFLGGRHDHELFNLGEALDYLKSHSESRIRIYEGHDLRFELFGSGTHDLDVHGLFSVGAIHSSTVQLTGECSYPIAQKTVLKPLSSFGLSNEGKGKIRLNNHGPVFLYFPKREA